MHKDNTYLYLLINFIINVKLNYYHFSSVKAAAVPVLGKLITDGTSREAKDKARLTLETMIKEYKTFPTSLVVTLIITLATAAPFCPQNFIEEGDQEFNN